MTLEKKTEQQRHTPWYAKAGAGCSIVPISRFVNRTIFALKTGGYGCLFSLTGIDEESLTDQELESRVRAIEASLRGLHEGSCLYQYARVLSGFDIPRQKKYSDPVTETFVNDRLTFLEKTAGFRRIDLHWCLTFEPSQKNPFQRKPTEKAEDDARMLSSLQKTATILESHLRSTVGLRLLEKAEAFPFFSYLYNLEPWCEHDQLTRDTGVDRQIVKSPLSWHSDHLRVGKRYVQMFSLMNTPEISRPCQFSGLTTLDCDSVLCTSWRAKSASAARSEISAQEKFISFFKVGVLTRVMSGKDIASLETGAGAKAADASVDDLSEVIRSLDKTAQGEFTLRLLLAARSVEQLRDTVPAVHRLFVDARAQVMEETLGNLSSFYTMFPGNQKFNVFPLWLGENHHARMSSVFAPHIGHPYSEDLDAEYLNVFETRTRTPFFQDAYVNGVRVMLVIGPPGTGKSVHANQMLALERKYNGFTYIFDIGGSYESQVELYGGKVDRVGKDGPRVNPFSLEPTENNIKFLYSFVKLLLTSGGAELSPEDDDVIHKAVQGNSDTVAIDFARGGTSSSGSSVVAANTSAPQTASGEDTTPLAVSSVAGRGTQQDSQSGNAPAEAQQRPVSVHNVAAPQSQKKDPMAAYDFDGYQGRLYRVFEGTVFEGVVTNHVDGGFAGPIIVMLTTDYYSHDHQQLLLPQGTRLIGNVQSVGSAQQRKLFVVFNRAVCPDGFSLDLNKYIGLDPRGTTGLATNVNNHILSSFAAAAAIGGLGGLAQIGNTGSILTADTQIRNGISEQSAQEAEQILNHFLNRLPVITVKEGSRARVYINQDILIPSYAEHRVDSAL